MRKSMRKAIVLLLSLMVILMCLTPGMAQADYNYRVRIFVGNQADPDRYDPEIPIFDQNYSAGSYCDLPMEMAKDTLAPGSKYYVKGFKVSGEGGETYCAAPSFEVDHDCDFIIAYGMPDNLVSYTINFVDAENGDVLADPITYYGNVGDKPVVAYQYIEGYRPLYRNLTGTLEAGSNNWSFPYVKLTPAEPETEAPAEQPTTAGGQTTGGQTTGGQTTGGQTTGGQTTGGQTTGGTGGETATETQTNESGEVITQASDEGTATGGTGGNTGTPAGGTGGNTGGTTGTPTGGTGGNTGGTTGGDTGTPAGNTGDNTGGNTGAPAGNTGDNTGGDTGAPADQAGGNAGGDTGAPAGGNDGQTAEPEGQQAGQTGTTGGEDTSDNTGGIDLGGNAGPLTTSDLGLYEDLEPIDILDLDVPLAAPSFDNKDTKDGEDGEAPTEGATTAAQNSESGTSAKGLSTTVIVIIVCACAVVIIIILLLIFKKKRK